MTPRPSAYASVDKAPAAKTHDWHLAIDDEGVATARLRTTAVQLTVVIEDNQGVLLETPPLATPGGASP